MNGVTPHVPCLRLWSEPSGCPVHTLPGRGGLCCLAAAANQYTAAPPPPAGTTPPRPPRSPGPGSWSAGAGAAAWTPQHSAAQGDQYPVSGQAVGWAEVPNFGIKVHHLTLIYAISSEKNTSQFNRNHFWHYYNIVCIDVRIGCVWWRARAMVGEW